MPASRLIADDIHLGLTVSGAMAAVRLQERRALPPELRELSLAFVLRNIRGLACWYVDSRIPVQGARFPFPAPVHADAYRHMFPGPLQFEASQAEIRFDARYLALPLRRDEKALTQMLQRALPLTVLQYRHDRLLVSQVRQVLAAHPERSHSAEALAALLHVSARTLHRQLKEEGASLQQLKDEVRLERARTLLYRTDKPLKQVAAAVGFANDKSFIRAFRHWTRAGAPGVQADDGAVTGSGRPAARAPRAGWQQPAYGCSGRWSLRRISSRTLRTWAIPAASAATSSAASTASPISR